MHILARFVFIRLVFCGFVSIAPCLVFSLEVSMERLIEADSEPENWMTYYGNLRGWRHSGLKQINRSNVNRLVAKWAFQTGPDSNLQATPIVVDGVMYISSANNHVFALNAENGELLWRFNHKLKEERPSRIWGGVSRGVSIAGGKVLTGTVDGFLLALDATSGKLLWQAEVGDADAGHMLSSPPLIVENMAIIGIATGEFSSRAYIDAYDINDGKRIWRFYTIPGPGEAGHDTWEGDSWKTGCAPAWLPGIYDNEEKSIYIGIGNPCAMWSGAGRKGDNLYSNSIVALDPQSGKLKWYFQTIPHDVWDYDAANELVMIDTEISGKPVKALFQAGKNGYLYALDRTSGRFLYGKPFISRMNWTSGLDASGRPVPDTVPTAEGAIVCPSSMGGKNWNHVAYSPDSGYLYIPAIDVCQTVYEVPGIEPKKGALFVGGEGVIERKGASGFLLGINPGNGETVWRYDSKYPMFASVLSTGGGLVFTGDVEGRALALDADTGKLLWSFNTGSPHRGSPVSYSVNGKQYVAIPSGWGGLAMKYMPMAFPELKKTSSGSTLTIFGLFEE